MADCPLTSREPGLRVHLLLHSSCDKKMSIRIERWWYTTTVVPPSRRWWGFFSDNVIHNILLDKHDADNVIRGISLNKPETDGWEKRIWSAERQMSSRRRQPMLSEKQRERESRKRRQYSHYQVASYALSENTCGSFTPAVKRIVWNSLHQFQVWCFILRSYFFSHCLLRCLQIIFYYYFNRRTDGKMGGIGVLRRASNKCYITARQPAV